MPLALASCGGWCSGAFNALLLKSGFGQFHRMPCCVAEACGATDGYVDRLAATVSNTTKELGIDNSLANAEARDGGQEQRPGRDLADHDRRDGEGF
jgi:hypothetical protein